MITIDEAFDLIDRETTKLTAEMVALAALSGRYLAQNIVADTDMPPFDRSQMDGFAVRFADTCEAPVELDVIGESAAGHGWTGELKSGQAVRIMTGAPLPRGADAVQKIELARELSDASCESAKIANTVEIREPVRENQFVVRRGDETSAGSVVFSAGERVTAKMIAPLAAFGYESAAAGPRPRVSILATGSEIVPVSTAPGADQIRNSNSPMLFALVSEFGGVPLILPSTSDDERELREAIEEGVGSAEILVITGGVSVGKYDLTKDVLRALGAEIFFERVCLKPGKPTVFARLGTTLIFGLPGNPVSAAVSFFLFVRRSMLAMQGAAVVGLPKSIAHVAKNVKAAAERDTFLPAMLKHDDEGRAVATPIKWVGSSDFIGFARSNVMIFIPAGARLIAGEKAAVFHV